MSEFYVFEQVELYGDVFEVLPYLWGGAVKGGPVGVAIPGELAAVG